VDITDNQRNEKELSQKLNDVDAECQQNDLVDPLTGEIVDKKNHDALIDAYERMDNHCKIVNTFRQNLVRAIYDQTTEATKTRRLRGEQRTIIVKSPDDTWDQKILKKAWETYPQFREEFLRIESFGVRLREYKKNFGTSGPKEFEEFKKVVESANRGPIGSPRIEKIER
jgi:hypothetical protein